MSFLSRLRRFPFWGWFWFILGVLYFVLPLYATVAFSLSWDPADPFKAYERSFGDRRFWDSFLLSNTLALTTILASIALVVPTAYWIRLKLPQARRIVEFLTL
ncbi:MAG TPA: hypothetical protein PLF42_05760, partial [Anaerolineales bacterium]|nr:hypothetical protein [Anaerolineales bacterium]